LPCHQDGYPLVPNSPREMAAAPSARAACASSAHHALRRVPLPSGSGLATSTPSQAPSKPLTCSLWLTTRRSTSPYRATGAVPRSGRSRSRLLELSAGFGASFGVMYAAAGSFTRTCGSCSAGWNSRIHGHSHSPDVPHDWLFPQMAAVVHHAGAGTTGAGLRAGVPAVAVPVLLDQPFWTGRLHHVGVAPTPLPQRDLTADALPAAIRSCLDEPGYCRRAANLAGRIRAEDGAAAVLTLVNALAD
jgi:hypothetical protein